MKKDIKQKYFNIIKTINQEIINIRQQLHSYPELPGQEEHTSNLLKHILKHCGYKVKTFSSHYGLVADLITDSKKDFIAVRADMDALPITEKTNKPYKSKNEGIMHACGHDAHAAIVLGVATVFQKLKSNLNGNIRFIFQPSEESKDGGSIEMIEDGAMKNVSTILALHTYPYLKTGKIGYVYHINTDS